MPIHIKDKNIKCYVKSKLACSRFIYYMCAILRELKTASPLHLLSHYQDRGGCLGHVVGHCLREVSPPVLSMDASSDGPRPEPTSFAGDCILNADDLRNR